MRRNKIKAKYLNLIKFNNKDITDNEIDTNNKDNNIFDKIENKAIKGFLSFLWIVLMLFWSIIPNIVLAIMNIDINTLSGTTKVIITLVNDILFLILLIGIYYKTLKKDFKKYFNQNLKNNLKTSISYWLVGFVIMLISNYIIAILTNGQLAENEETVRNMIDIAPLYMIFQITIYAPISEELIFRKSIRDAINNKWAFAIVSGLIFGGLHAITSITDTLSLLYLVPYCSLGIAFGLLYAKTDNIFSTIVVHTLHNTLALITYFTTL